MNVDFVVVVVEDLAGDTVFSLLGGRGKLKKFFFIKETQYPHGLKIMESVFLSFNSSTG